MGRTACSRPQFAQPLQPEAFEKAITDSDVPLVDARIRKEYVQGPIKSAVLIDYLQHSPFRSNFEKLDKERTVNLGCIRGPRSR